MSTGPTKSAGCSELGAGAAGAEFSPFYGGRGAAFNRRMGRVWAFVWLGWLAYPVIALLESRASDLHMALTLLLAAVGVGFYASLFARPALLRPATRWTWGALAGLTAVAAGLTAFDSTNWLYLLFFVVSGSAMRLPPRQFAPVFGLALGILALVLWLAGTDPADIGYSVGGMFGIGALLSAFRRALVANFALHQAREELARLAVSEERLRFARDLHDLLGHSLSVIALKAELAGRLIEPSPDRAAGEVADIESVARSALSEVREAVGGYRRPGLTAELASARSALAAAGIGLQLTGFSEAAALAPEVAGAAAWALREGTTNVIRHSGAHTCSVILARGPAELRMTVADDGRGPAGGGDPAGGGRGPAGGGGPTRGGGPTGGGGDPAGGGGGASPAGASLPDGGGRDAGGDSVPHRYSTTASLGLGHGLQGLGERVGTLGGQLQAGAGPEGGFLLQVTIPTGATVVPEPGSEKPGGPGGAPDTPRSDADNPDDIQAGTPVEATSPGAEVPSVRAS